MGHSDGTPVIVPSRKRARCINLILEKNVFCLSCLFVLCKTDAPRFRTLSLISFFLSFSLLICFEFFCGIWFSQHSIPHKMNDSDQIVPLAQGAKDPSKGGANTLWFPLAVSGKE